MSEYSVSSPAHVQEVEPPRVRHLLIYYFLQGIGLSLFFTVANALFLSSFVANDLPMAYIGSAIVLLILGKGYDLLAQKVSVNNRAFLLIVISVSVLLLYIFTQVIPAVWVAFLLFVWSRVLFSITDLEFWGITNLLNDTRHSKSLFGWMNMRDVPAKVIGYFSVGLLLQVVELPVLLLIAGIVFFINFFVLRLLLDPRYAKPESATATAPLKAAPIWHFGASGLMLLLSLLAVIGVICFSFINFTFLWQVEDKFHTASELASYIGLVFGIAYAIIAVGKVVFTNKLLAMIGGRAAMLLLPLYILVAGIFLYTRVANPEEHLITFFVVLLVGAEVFRSVFYQPVLLTLTQPLPAALRQRSYIVLKGLVEPLGLAFAGVVLYYIIGKNTHPDMRFINQLLMGLAVVWAGLVLLTFGKYISTLKAAISEKALATRSIDSFNSFSQAIMKEKLQSSNPEEVIYAHQLCADNDPNFFPAEVGKLLRHEATSVRKYALEKMSLRQPFTDMDILIYLGNKDASVYIRQLAIIQLGARYKDSFSDEYNAFLDHEDLRIREAAIKGLMESGNPEIIMIASHKLNDLIKGTDAKQNIAAATIIGDMHLNSHYTHLEQFFKNSDVKVRIAAIKAAAKLVHPKLMPVLFTMFTGKEQIEETIIALSNYKTDVINYLMLHKELLQQYPAEILGICKRIDDKIAVMLICQYILPQSETEVLDESLQALYVTKAEKTDVDRGTVELKLISLGAFLHSCLHYHAQLPDTAYILKDALASEIKNAKRRLLLLLSLLYDKKAFARIIAAVDKMTPANKEATIKMFDALDDNHRKRFLPVFDLTDNAALMEHMSKFYTLQVKEDVCEAILLHTKSPFLLWTQAVALYTNLLELSDDILLPYKDHPEEMISEMVQLALSRKPFALRMIEDDSNVNFVNDQSQGDRLLNIEKLVALKSIPLFHSFSQSMLSAMSNVMTEQRYTQGNVVYEEGADGEIMYIIYYGIVSLFNGTMEIMRTGRKEVLVKIDSADQRLASAKAFTDTLLFMVNKEDIEALKYKQPEMAQSVLNMFSKV